MDSTPKTAMQAAYGITQTNPYTSPALAEIKDRQNAVAETEARKMLDTYAPGWEQRQPFTPIEQ